MSKSTKSESVPETMQAKFVEITTITDKFCQNHLNDEYAQQCRYLTAALCRKRPSPLTSGKANTWACGIVHAIGMVNFLFDTSQTPHMKATEIYQVFGVSQSTGQAKSKQVRDLMNIHQIDSSWCLPSRIDDYPLAWMISVNGFLLDARQAPRAIQEEAFRKGMIPYLPEDKTKDN
ncbi:MAG: DUF6398 domain-containing protein [Pseudanabaenaceae cyanobacterium bins.39]|nr:DUF6398 domain-containing protein [Pseudanabaenaceae cyanobacterium bins.39]